MERSCAKLVKSLLSVFVLYGLRDTYVTLHSRSCQEKHQSRETQTLKSLRSITKYKRNTDSEILQKQNIRKTHKKHRESLKNKRILEKRQGPWPVAGGVLCQWRHCMWLVKWAGWRPGNCAIAYCSQCRTGTKMKRMKKPSFILQTTDFT